MAKGYIYNKRANKWYVRMKVEGKVRNIPCESEEEAIEMAKEVKYTHTKQRRDNRVKKEVSQDSELLARLTALERRVAFLEEQLELRVPSQDSTEAGHAYDSMDQVYNQVRDQVESQLEESL